MPHDANGNVIEAGDIVSIRFKVTQVSSGDDYCNVTLQSVIPMPPENKYCIDLSAVNTRQTEKVTAV